MSMYLNLRILFLHIYTLTISKKQYIINICNKLIKMSALVFA